MRGKTLALGYAARATSSPSSTTRPGRGRPGPALRGERGVGVPDGRRGDRAPHAVPGSAAAGRRRRQRARGGAASCNDVEERLGAGVAVVVRDGSSAGVLRGRRGRAAPRRHDPGACRPPAFAGVLAAARADGEGRPRGAAAARAESRGLGAGRGRATPDHATTGRPYAPISQPSSAGPARRGYVLRGALGGTSLQAVEAAWRLGVAPDDVLRLKASAQPLPPPTRRRLAPRRRPPTKMLWRRRRRSAPARRHCGARGRSSSGRARADAAWRFFDDGRKGLSAGAFRARREPPPEKRTPPSRPRASSWAGRPLSGGTMGGSTP